MKSLNKPKKKQIRETYDRDYHNELSPEEWPENQRGFDGSHDAAGDGDVFWKGQYITVGAELDQLDIRRIQSALTQAEYAERDAVYAQTKLHHSDPTGYLRGEEKNWEARYAKVLLSEKVNKAVIYYQKAEAEIEKIARKYQGSLAHDMGLSRLHKAIRATVHKLNRLI